MNFKSLFAATILFGSVNAAFSAEKALDNAAQQATTIGAVVNVAEANRQTSDAALNAAQQVETTVKPVASVPASINFDVPGTAGTVIAPNVVAEVAAAQAKNTNVAPQTPAPTPAPVSQIQQEINALVKKTNAETAKLNGTAPDSIVTDSALVAPAKRTPSASETSDTTPIAKNEAPVDAQPGFLSRGYTSVKNTVANSKDFAVAKAFAAKNYMWNKDDSKTKTIVKFAAAAAILALAAYTIKTTYDYYYSEIDEDEDDNA